MSRHLEQLTLSALSDTQGDIEDDIGMAHDVDIGGEGSGANMSTTYEVQNPLFFFVFLLMYDSLTIELLGSLEIAQNGSHSSCAGKFTGKHPSFALWHVQTRQSSKSKNRNFERIRGHQTTPEQPTCTGAALLLFVPTRDVVAV